MAKEDVSGHLDDAFMVIDEDDEFQENKYLTFSIGEETYAIDISDITEIIELQKITEVPDLPEYVRGVINLRGRVIPVMDLRMRFKMVVRDYDDRTCIVIVNINESAIGFIVDRVLEVVDIPEDNIDPPPQFKSASGKEKYIKGLGKVENEVKIILDSQKVIFQEDLEKIIENSGGEAKQEKSGDNKKGKK